MQTRPDSDVRDTTGDWPEDFSKENGDYLNACVRCDAVFAGYKRRVVCKRCQFSQALPENEKRA